MTCRPPLATAASASVIAAAALHAAELPDIRSVPQDLDVPPMQVAQPAPGRRVKATHPSYQGSDVYHVLYLPTDWVKGRHYPVIIEYAGNGPYRNARGDACSGRVEDCNLGYGISGGKGVIWACLPCISADRTHNQLQWWGDVEATVAYCKQSVKQICAAYGGDPAKVFVAGFSRGAIACNYIGLHDDEIAALWCGFICHSHYDGVTKWGYTGSDRKAAAGRLGRLGERPQFISHETSLAATERYLNQVCPSGNFTFQALPYPNHTDAWVLRDIEERGVLREWFDRALNKNDQPQRDEDDD